MTIDERSLELGKKEYDEKIDKKEKETEFYKKKIRHAGLKLIDRFLKYHPEPSKHMISGITYAHRDLELVASSMANNKPWAVVSGLNPSGPLHLGHLSIFEELLWMQKNGAEVFIPITNDESYVVNKLDSIGEGRRIAYEQIIPSIVAMGFDKNKTHIFVDSDYLDIYNIAMDVSKHITLNTALNVFGFEEKADNPGTLFYRAAVQVAQILLPQYEEFGGKKPTVVPVGIDQHPYLVLSRNVAEKKNLIPPAELSIKFLQGVDGKGKMSASREESAIFLTDDPDVAYKKVLSSYTGGNSYSDFQRKFGGVPDICPVYNIVAHHFDKADQLYSECSNGKLLCGDCKENVANLVKSYLQDFQQKLKNISNLEDYILRTPITSVKNIPERF